MSGALHVAKGFSDELPHAFISMGIAKDASSFEGLCFEIPNFGIG
jgi:hypothetical protein